MAHEEMRLRAYADDKAEIAIAIQNTAMQMPWMLVRKGRPNSQARIIWRGDDRATAHARFEHEKNRMRQGMLALVDSDGNIWSYHSEPMPRRRW